MLDKLHSDAIHASVVYADHSNLVQKDAFRYIDFLIEEIGHLWQTYNVEKIASVLSDMIPHLPLDKARCLVELKLGSMAR